MHLKAKTLGTLIWGASLAVVSAAELKEAFSSPPDAARPGVYWYFMDGNMDRETRAPLCADNRQIRKHG